MGPSPDVVICPMDTSPKVPVGVTVDLKPMTLCLFTPNTTRGQRTRTFKSACPSTLEGQFERQDHKLDCDDPKSNRVYQLLDECFEVGILWTLIKTSGSNNLPIKATVDIKTIIENLSTILFSQADFLKSGNQHLETQQSTTDSTFRTTKYCSTISWSPERCL